MVQQRVQAFCLPAAKSSPLRRSGFLAPGRRCVACPLRPPRRGVRSTGAKYAAPKCLAKSSDTATIEELRAFVQQKTAEGMERLDNAETLGEVDSLRVSLLGKKGEVTGILKTIGKLPKEDRPQLGELVNKAKRELEDRIALRKEAIENEAYEKQMEEEWVDVTQPGLPHVPVAYRHPLMVTMERACDIFAHLGYSIIDEPADSPEIETDWYNFEALNTPPDHPARDMHDTYYVDEVDDTGKQLLLRTHTSSVQIRYMEKHKPPYCICSPGRVYRRDNADATHSALFHQIEILNLQRRGELNIGHLKGTVTHFLEEFFGPDIEVRFRASYFPFTEPSMEVDVLFRGKWLEVLGCGMVDPRVLQKVGVDPDEWVGFAAGFGAERFCMVLHQIPDIRELYRNDIRFLRQFPAFVVD